MKLASPEAMNWEPNLDPPAFDCYHPRRSVVLGLTVCPDCGDQFMTKEQEDALLDDQKPAQGYAVDKLRVGGVNENTNTVTMIGVEIAARILRSSGHDLAATRCERLISDFEMARQWNSLAELEIKNLRSLAEAMNEERNKFRVERDLAVERHASAIEDMAALRVERYALAEQCAKLQIRVGELERSLEQSKKDMTEANKRAQHYFTAHGTLDGYKGKIEALDIQNAEFRTMLLELCEKMEAGISGAEETKRVRTMLLEPMELPIGDDL